MLKIALAGLEKDCEEMIAALSHLATVQLTVVAPADQLSAALIELFAQAGIPVVDKQQLFKGRKAPDLLFLCSDKLSAKEIIGEQKQVVVFDYEKTKLFGGILGELYRHLATSEENREKYLSALNAATEGVQIINEHGVIEYINPAFSKITGIHSSERIGTSIFAVSPDGSGTRVLRTGQSAVGVLNQAVGSCAEVISNGAPIIIKGRQRGAVVVFQELTDILRLSKELSTTKALIESLNNELGYVKTSKYTFNDLIGGNKTLLEAVNLSKRAAKNDSTILITGESGTGKEILAHAIHQAGPRWNKPFITVNCASIPDSLIESELFGHEKGAFTGADKLKAGKFELANNGTIFLDEIGDLNFNVQAKLLRVLQEKEIERVGGNDRLAINVKILAATNKNLADMVHKGIFRADLFYRLQVISVCLPPLRERKDDIPQLVDYILTRICRKHGKPVPAVHSSVLPALTAYAWPGNIRELENVLTRALTLCDGASLSADHFRWLLKPPIVSRQMETDEVMALDKMEQLLISRALKKYGTTTPGKQAAAKALNISLGTLYNKIKLYRLDQTDR